MPLFIPLLGAAYASIAAVITRFLLPYIVVKVCLMLGLTITTFVGLDLLSDYLVTQVQSNYAGLPSDLLSIMAMLGVFDWIEIVLAAWVAAINIQSLKGAFKTISMG